MTELGMTTLAIATHSPDANYNASRGGYLIGGTLVLVPPFRLDDDDDEGVDETMLVAGATGDLWV